jgi:UDP-glucose 4-epimerase
MVIPRFVQQALAGQSLTVFGDGQQSRSFCDVDDAVRAIVDLSEHREAVGQVFNIGAHDEITIEDLARRVLSLVDGADSDAERIRHIPYEQAYADGFEDMHRRLPDTSKIHSLTGWQPRISLDQTLRRVIDYHRSNANP